MMQKRLGLGLLVCLLAGGFAVWSMKLAPQSPVAPVDAPEARAKPAQSSAAVRPGLASAPAVDRRERAPRPTPVDDEDESGRTERCGKIVGMLDADVPTDDVISAIDDLQWEGPITVADQACLEEASVGPAVLDRVEDILEQQWDFGGD